MKQSKSSPATIENDPTWMAEQACGRGHTKPPVEAHRRTSVGAGAPCCDGVPPHGGCGGGDTDGAE